MTGKGMELVDTMVRRKINLACVQETKWVGAKAKEIDGFKLYYTGVERNRNGVGIMVDKSLKDCVTSVVRKEDRIILV
ncbi:hypothetical protein, partial [Methylobacterium haplocladii]|uniref:hypothetical protein n=1 Tax=Methylobacterium haplocladii TaxID=1176176 RepID=UPI0024E04D0C